MTKWKRLFTVTIPVCKMHLTGKNGTTICIIYRKRLFAGTVPANKNLFARTVQANKNLFAGTIPANKNLFAGTCSGK